MLDKTNKVFIFNICCFYTTSLVSFYFLVHCTYSRFSKWRPYFHIVWLRGRKFYWSIAITPKWIPILSQPQKDRPWAKIRRMSHKLWKSIHGFDLSACQRKIQYNQVTNQEKSQNR